MRTAVATAIALATAVLTYAPASADEPEPFVSLHEAFSDIEDGPAPDTIVGGTALVENYQGYDAAAPYVRDGFLTTTDPDTAIGGAYRIAKLDEDVTTVGATFAFSPYSAGGGVLCLSIQSSSIATTPSVPASPLHFIISPTDWGLDVNKVAGTGVDGLIGGEIAPLAADGKTLHTLVIELDRASSKVRITLPSGKVITYTNPALSLPGQYVYVEPFKSPNGGPLSAQTNALVSEWWAGTEPVSITEPAVSVPLPRAPEPTVVAEITPEPEPVAAVAPAPVPTIAKTAPPAAPRGVRAVRHGVRVVTKWRAADSVRVKCGTTTKAATGKRAVLRTTASRCKVRAVTSAGKSAWVATKVR